MPRDHALVDRVRAALGSTPHVEEKQMFGGTAFMVRGKIRSAGSGKRWSPMARRGSWKGSFEPDGGAEHLSVWRISPFGTLRHTGPCRMGAGLLGSPAREATRAPPVGLRTRSTLLSFWPAL
jgi:hypothetical protein